ncbi:MAG: LamG domain-containing protein [Bacteroidetes bacterium]|nr:LamG domain-containing protein [Bacteroidota bacterium]
MKTFSLLICTFFLAALVNSCQKDSQAPAAKVLSPAADFGTRTLSGGSGLSYTVNLGMIDYYPFHGNANDGSGHHHDGQPLAIGIPPDFSTVTAPPSLVANKYGVANEAYKFDGLDDVIWLLDQSPAVFDHTKAQTQFCLYVRYKSDGTGALLSSGPIGNYYPDEPGFSLQAGVNSANFIWNDYFKANGQITASVNSGVITGCKNSWVDVTVNFSNSVLTMYINGKKVSTVNSPFPGPAHFDDGIQIGTETVRYPQNFFNSAIDEVRIYNRPLTDDEIAYLYAH